MSESRQIEKRGNPGGLLSSPSKLIKKPKTLWRSWTARTSMEGPCGSMRPRASLREALLAHGGALMVTPVVEGVETSGGLRKAEETEESKKATAERTETAVDNRKGTATNYCELEQSGSSSGP